MILGRYSFLSGGCNAELTQSRPVIELHNPIGLGTSIDLPMQVGIPGLVQIFGQKYTKSPSLRDSGNGRR